MSWEVTREHAASLLQTAAAEVDRIERRIRTMPDSPQCVALNERAAEARETMKLCATICRLYDRLDAEVRS